MPIKKKQSTLSSTDFDQIRTIVSEAVAIEVSGQLGEKLAFLPTKDEFYTKMDEVLGEVKGMREEFAAHVSSHDEIETDLTKIKQNVDHLYKIFEVEKPVAPSY